MKVAILAGGTGSRLSEETECQAQADGRDRRPADPLAHHEALRALRLQRLRRSRSATRASTSSATSSTTASLRRDLTVVARATARVSATATATAREDWTVDLVDTGLRTPRPAGASSAWRPTSATSTFMLTWGDGVADVDLDDAARVPPLAREARDGDRRAPAGPLRPPRARRRPGRASSPRSRRLGEGWINGAFFVLEPRGVRLHRGRRHALGARAARAARRATAS